MYTTEIENYLRKTGFRAFTPKAALFDMDGVLYDSMPNHAYSWHTSMASFGIEMSEADAYAYEGMRGVETIKKIVKEQRGVEITDEESQRMYDEKSRIFSTRPKALMMVVVTGSGQVSLLEKLVHDFKGLIEPGMIVSSFDVKRGKPNPEPYLKGLAKAGVEPWEAIVVENAPLGVRAAQAARIFTVAVNTGPLPNKMLADEGADLIFNKMTDFRDKWDSFL